MQPSTYKPFSPKSKLNCSCAAILGATSQITCFAVTNKRKLVPEDLILANMSAITVLCEQSELAVIHRGIADRLEGSRFTHWVKFESLGEGNLVMNHVNALITGDFTPAFVIIDSYLRTRGFRRTDEGFGCHIYRR